MMEMLKEKYNTDLVDLDKEIEILWSSGNQFSPEFAKKEQELIQYLENYNKNLILKKRSTIL